MAGQDAIAAATAAADQKTAPPPSSASQLAEGEFQPPPYAPPPASATAALRKPHTNAVIEAGIVRAKDEVYMQNMLQNAQLRYGIYNTDITPEHDNQWCNCAVCQLRTQKWRRLPVQDMWSKAVMYPGEKAYTENNLTTTAGMGWNNPYQMRVVSPFQRANWSYGPATPSAKWHAMSVRQTIDLNNELNKKAQKYIDSVEPRNLWGDEDVKDGMAQMNLNDEKKGASDEKRQSMASSSTNGESSSTNGKLQRPPAEPRKATGLRKLFGMRSSEEKAIAKVTKGEGNYDSLRQSILDEEQGRWPDASWRQIVATYQAKVGMSRKIADLRRNQPIQYLHLLRAGYFEPIPVAWANLPSNPLKFSIEPAGGWRGITPAWRGYEDTAEERLYWVLNHREGSAAGTRLKPDFISALEMARQRMASAVEPPPEYFAADDTCHVQHTSDGYTKQVLPKAFQAYDRPEVPSDDTMILLDVSGSMDFDPMKPCYDRYLITGYTRTNQPKNKDVAKAVIRRFTDAMANHDHSFYGYDFVTFANSAKHIGTVTHRNLDQMWREQVKLGGGTRVMTGWQKVKALHFEKHSASATHHPVYGWQAGPETPMLRLLLLLDGEATDMDEFELDLLGCEWAHVTIFLIGAEGCPHHHRHANELQRISDVNHHVSFVDAQGNCPERYVTHELLKRHLGYDMSLREFQGIEELPEYSVTEV